MACNLSRGLERRCHMGISWHAVQGNLYGGMDLNQVKRESHVVGHDGVPEIHYLQYNLCKGR